MPLFLEHRFVLGRFHANRWNQSPFEDVWGEWPPSPWRLLRALAARWFEYSRETGDADRQKLERLFSLFATELPAYVLPVDSRRGPSIRQYEPTSNEWTDPKKGNAACKRPGKTLVEDRSRVLPADDRVFWCWEHLEIDPSSASLLDELLFRMLYFGRAESACRIRRLTALPAGVQINCRLAASDDGDSSPVLAAVPNPEFDPAVLLLSTDDSRLAGLPIPPGTAWYFARLPQPIGRDRPALAPRNAPSDLHCVQFAISGNVLPPSERWVKVSERFRGAVLKCMAVAMVGDPDANYGSLTPEQKDRLALISGKDGLGQPLKNHVHAYFIVWPGPDGKPARMIVWRRGQPFTPEEINGFRTASSRRVYWLDGGMQWPLALMPLADSEPMPEGFAGRGQAWSTLTPFVPPIARHPFRKGGRTRSGEGPEASVRRLVVAAGLPEPVAVSVARDAAADWPQLHETRSHRFSGEAHTRLVRPGFLVRIEFPQEIVGPLILGESAHFGLGLFVPARSGKEG